MVTSGSGLHAWFRLVLASDVLIKNEETRLEVQKLVANNEIEELKKRMRYSLVNHLSREIIAHVSVS